MIQFFKYHGLSLGRGITNLIFPDKCLKCGIYIRLNPVLPLSACYCSSCLGKSLPIFQSPFCPCCGHVFSSRAGGNHLCESCLKKKPVLHQVRAAFEYKGLIRDAVAQFKYQSRLSLAHPFEQHLFKAFETWFGRERIHIILPIPLHRKKARQRGFNQSFLLIRNFMRLYEKKYRTRPPWDIDIRSLARIRYTPSQTGLDIKERHRNLKQAFKWVQNRDLKGKNVLLVDDVYTTGATCHAAARVLKASGAQKISALVLTRA